MFSTNPQKSDENLFALQLAKKPASLAAIDQLPDELLWIITTFLDAQSLRALSQISGKWYLLLNNLIPELGRQFKVLYKLLSSRIQNLESTNRLCKALFGYYEVSELQVDVQRNYYGNALIYYKEKFQWLFLLLTTASESENLDEYEDRIFYHILAIKIGREPIDAPIIVPPLKNFATNYQLANSFSFKDLYEKYILNAVENKISQFNFACSSTSKRANVKILRMADTQRSVQGAICNLCIKGIPFFNSVREQARKLLAQQNSVLNTHINVQEGSIIVGYQSEVATQLKSILDLFKSGQVVELTNFQWST